MKPANAIAFIMLLTSLFLCTSCSSKSENSNYSITRTGITEIKGTSLMAEEVISITIPEENWEDLLSKIESLGLKKTGTKNEHKGWEYFFRIAYTDGTTINITFSNERTVIGGYLYERTNYSPDIFSDYFN